MPLLGSIKTLVRIPAIFFYTMSVFVVRCCVRPIALFAPDVDRRARQALMKLWGKGVLAILGGRINVRGTPPAPPSFTVSNHLTYVDVFVLSALMGVVFVAKAEVNSWPIIGLLCRQTQMIFINREQLRDIVRVKELVGGAFDRGYAVHIFAEGGISQDTRVQPFKPALLDVASRNGYPVHYASITYRTPDGSTPASQTVAWLEGKSFFRHACDLAAARGFEAVVTFGESPLVREDRKVLARELTEAVRENYTPVV